MSRTIVHAHRAWRSLYRDDRADAADRRDFRRGAIADPSDLWSTDEALGEMLDHEAAIAGDDEWTDYFDRLDAEDDRADDPGCYCRRCLLHDDPGGCLVVEAEIAAAERAERLARYDFDADAECGWAAPTMLVHSDWQDNNIFDVWEDA